MKVSEAIDQLKIGDTVWVKGEVEYIDKSGALPLYLKFAETIKYISGDDEISITEPKNEKVEVTQEFADWFEKSMMWKHNGSWAAKEIAGYGWGAYMHDPETGGELLPHKYRWVIAVQNNKENHIKAIYDGYTVKPKRWVVKNEKGYVAMENFKDFDNHKIGVKFTIVSEKSEAAYWDNIDHAKAEAVATLIDGSVEEV